MTRFVRDIYVDPYEMSEISGLRGMIRFQNNWTDLENPAWFVQSGSTVLLQLVVKATGNLISSDTVKIPIHFRYQKPQSHSRFDGHPELETIAESVGGMMNPAGYIPVNVPLPRLLLHCSDWSHQESDEHCHFVRTLCDTSSSGNEPLCQWAALPYKSVRTSDFRS